MSSHEFSPRHAVLPAQAPPPFPEPILLSARRVTGLVLTPPPSEDGSSFPPSIPVPAAAADPDEHDPEDDIMDDDGIGGGGSHPQRLQSPPPPSSPLTSLKRQASVSGNILLVTTNTNTADTTTTAAKDTTTTNNVTKAFMLQRKLKSTMFGTIRVAYVLKDKTADQNNNGPWEVVVSSSSSSNTATEGTGTTTASTGEGAVVEPEYEMVAITMEDKAKVLHHHGHCHTARDPKTELSALQMVAAAYNTKNNNHHHHVEGSNMIAVDDKYVYTITPYHNDGSLFGYCASAGTLGEPEARLFFRQILEGLATLQSVEICHRDLSLEKVYLRNSTCCTILGLSCALRIPITKDEKSGGSIGNGIPHMIEPQPPCASNPQTAAPELLRNEPFDGYAVDLWAAGIMLFTMLLGADALFAAPVMEDRKFKIISCEGNLRGLLLTTTTTATEDEEEEIVTAAAEPKTKKRSKSNRTMMISDSAIDLLQQMLRADPRDRPTLSEVQQYPWVVVAEGGMVDGGGGTS